MTKLKYSLVDHQKMSQAEIIQFICCTSFKLNILVFESLVRQMMSDSVMIIIILLLCFF